ncbi:hypothetical protein DdX_17999 [Ditylenchus destructor]|uniref:Uncharacterized protein n=1 Tax=Ditylenchus destructor TaxID=166010 RepID=A0AAD4ML36_9BILA|nr:hypothetical protein DdX_17999 [Ditylenchus destructor]
MEHIRSYVEVLKPLRHFISDFEMSLQPMLDKLLFRFKHLGSHFHKIMDTSENRAMKWNIAFAANCALSRKLKALNIKPMLISAFLNPTICKRLDRISTFLNEKYELNLSIDVAKNELIQFAAQQGIGTENVPNEQSLYDEEEDNLISEVNVVSSLEFEISSYISQKNAILTVPEKFDVLQYWAQSKGVGHYILRENEDVSYS